VSTISAACAGSDTTARVIAIAVAPSIDLKFFITLSIYKNIK
jgi:hypothetical protein